MGDLEQLLELIRLENCGEIEKLEVVILKLLNDGAAEPATQRWLAERLNCVAIARNKVKFVYLPNKLDVDGQTIEKLYPTFGSLYCETKYNTKSRTTEIVDEIIRFSDSSKIPTDKSYKYIKIFKETPK